MKPFIGTEKRSDTSKAWLLYITKIPERPVQGYEDDLENSYLWDHTTENGRHVAVGDLIVLWDGKQALGISVISHITTSKGKKTTNRCPSCKKALDSPRRKTKKPQYRCRDCEYEFDEPDTETKDVGQERNE